MNSLPKIITQYRKIRSSYRIDIAARLLVLVDFFLAKIVAMEIRAIHCVFYVSRFLYEYRLFPQSSKQKTKLV